MSRELAARCYNPKCGMGILHSMHVRARPERHRRSLPGLPCHGRSAAHAGTFNLLGLWLGLCSARLGVLPEMFRRRTSLFIHHPVGSLRSFSKSAAGDFSQDFRGQSVCGHVCDFRMAVSNPRWNSFLKSFGSVSIKSLIVLIQNTSRKPRANRDLT